MVHIYALLHPANKEIRYVGKTGMSLSHRYNCHVADKTKSYRGKWVRSLIKQGLKPELIVLETVGMEKWIEAEQFWIAYFRFLGARLTNKCDGGEGASGHKPSLETRMKLSEASRGRTHSAETKGKISNMAMGNKRASGFKHSQSFRDGISQRFKGKPFTAERKAQLSELRKGKRWSDKQRAYFEMKDAEKLKLIPEAAQLWAKGSTQKEISSLTGLSVSYLSSRIKKLDNYLELKAQNIINVCNRKDIKEKRYGSQKKPAKKMIVEKECVVCGSLFTSWSCYEKRGGNKFCSRQCYYQGRWKKSPTLSTYYEPGTG